MRTTRSKRMAARRWRKRHPREYSATTTYSCAKLYIRKYSTLDKLQHLVQLISTRERELKGDER